MGKERKDGWRQGRERREERWEEGRKETWEGLSSEQASFTEDSQEEDKGREELDGHLCMCGGRETQVSGSHSAPDVASLSLPLTSCCYCLYYCCFNTCPGHQSGRHNPQAQSGGLAHVQKAHSATDAPTRAWAFLSLLLSASPASSAAQPHGEGGNGGWGTEEGSGLKGCII